VEKAASPSQDAPPSLEEIPFPATISTLANRRHAGMVALTAVRTFATELYDVETRPQKVADTLLSLGADKVLSKVGLVDDADKIVTAVASMTTISGLIEKKESAMKLAAPYIAKVRDADGRKELKEDLVAAKQSGQAILTERVNGAVTKSKEFAAPYVAEAKK